jgi:DNA-binding NtrC family response regulator
LNSNGLLHIGGVDNGFQDLFYEGGTKIAENRPTNQNHLLDCVSRTHSKKFSFIFGNSMAAGGGKKIIVLDADRVRRDTLRSLLVEGGHLTFIFEDEKKCLDNFLDISPDLVVACSVSNQGVNRFVSYLKWMKAGIPILIISDDLSLNEFVEAVGFSKIGILRENFDIFDVRQEISRLLNDGTSIFPLNGSELPLIVGKSPVMVRIRRMIRALGQLQDPVFIQGEPGCGKELVANAIHFQSTKGRSPFVRVSGEAISSENTPAGFEGHANPWSFVCAGRRRILGTQRDGTLFIDEVGFLPPVFQCWLLLINGSERNGLPEGECPTGMRIITSSSTDLTNAMVRGEFRQDLYHRLSVIKIEIPPLRKRPDDIQPLVDFFTDRFCLSLGKSRFDWPAVTKTAFLNYSWPGNVRELERMVKRVVVLGAADTVIEKLCLSSDAKDAPPLVGFGKDFLASADILTDHTAGRFNNFSLKRIARQYIRQVERRAIQNALDTTGGNRKKAAHLLEISYKSLLNKIEAYDLS